MSSVPTPADIAAARQQRARARAARAETACAEQSGRADLLLAAARAHLDAGDVAQAREQVVALLDRADEDPNYAPPWFQRQARHLLEIIDQSDDDGAVPIPQPR